jgi:hydroxymethylbilane synthase
LFVSEIERAVLDGRADFAVHSMKDLPAELAARLVIACVPEREDPRDAFVTAQGNELDELEAGARVGTGSFRRALQLKRRRNDLAYVPLRGNVDTRLSRVDEGKLDAVVVAMAGLKRLGLAERPLWPMPPEVSLPAVGQGTLALEARADASDVLEVLGRIEHGPSRAAAEAERAFLKALGGDCHGALAGYARFEAGLSRLRFDGWVGEAPHGPREVRAGTERFIDATSIDLLSQARDIGREVGERLLAQGADELLHTDP